MSLGSQRSVSRFPGEEPSDKSSGATRKTPAASWFPCAVDEHCHPSIAPPDPIRLKKSSAVGISQFVTDAGPDGSSTSLSKTFFADFTNEIVEFVFI